MMNPVNADLDVLRAGDRLRGSMSPLRQRLLEELGSEPGSATMLAARLGESRQRVNYHLRELEKSGFVELVELRQRRGRTERILRAKARTVVVAPAIIGEREASIDQDRFAADTLLASAARTFDEVAGQRERAEAAGKRLVTFTIEASIGFAEPADIERFATELGERVAELAAAYHQPESGRTYRLVIGGHPRTRPEEPGHE
jgi:DNA-binding transcriptional ArsR family regulator